MGLGSVLFQPKVNPIVKTTLDCLLNFNIFSKAVFSEKQFYSLPLQ